MSENKLSSDGDKDGDEDGDEKVVVGREGGRGGFVVRGSWLG